MSTPANSASRRRRRRRLLAFIGAPVLAVLVFVFVYFEPHKAFIDDEVHETIPGLAQVIATTPASSATTAVGAATVVPTTDAAIVSAETSVPAATAPPPPAEPAASTTTAPVPTTAPQPPPAANSVSAAKVQAAATNQPVVLSSGQFISGEHDTSGTALVVALPDGSVVVRFEGLDTSNGPDLRVVLSPDVASASFDYSGRLVLEELKGNIGDQNYVLGAEVDLAQYRSVVIWCERFSVSFGAAPLDVVA